MKFEIELDEINTYKIIVDAPSEVDAEIVGDNIDIAELSRQKKEIGFNGTGYLRHRTIGRNAKLIK